MSEALQRVPGPASPVGAGPSLARWGRRESSGDADAL
jgi:hypothetical protein